MKDTKLDALLNEAEASEELTRLVEETESHPDVKSDDVADTTEKTEVEANKECDTSLDDVADTTEKTEVEANKESNVSTADVEEVTQDATDVKPIENSDEEKEVAPKAEDLGEEYIVENLSDEDICAILECYGVEPTEENIQYIRENYETLYLDEDLKEGLKKVGGKLKKVGKGAAIATGIAATTFGLAAGHNAAKNAPIYNNLQTAETTSTIAKQAEQEAKDRKESNNDTKNKNEKEIERLENSKDEKVTDSNTETTKEGNTTTTTTERDKTPEEKDAIDKDIYKLKCDNEILASKIEDDDKEAQTQKDKAKAAYKDAEKYKTEIENNTKASYATAGAADIVGACCAAEFLLGKKDGYKKGRKDEADDVLQGKGKYAPNNDKSLNADFDFISNMYNYLSQDNLPKTKFEEAIDSLSESELNSLLEFSELIEETYSEDVDENDNLDDSINEDVLDNMALYFAARKGGVGIKKSIGIANATTPIKKAYAQILKTDILQKKLENNQDLTIKDRKKLKQNNFNQFRDKMNEIILDASKQRKEEKLSNGQKKIDEILGHKTTTDGVEIPRVDISINKRPQKDEEPQKDKVKIVNLKSDSEEPEVKEPKADKPVETPKVEDKEPAKEVEHVEKPVEIPKVEDKEPTKEVNDTNTSGSGSNVEQGKEPAKKVEEAPKVKQDEQQGETPVKDTKQQKVIENEVNNVDSNDQNVPGQGNTERHKKITRDKKVANKITRVVTEDAAQFIARDILSSYFVNISEDLVSAVADRLKSYLYESEDNPDVSSDDVEDVVQDVTDVKPIENSDEEKEVAPKAEDLDDKLSEAIDSFNKFIDSLHEEDETAASETDKAPIGKEPAEVNPSVTTDDVEEVKQDATDVKPIENSDEEKEVAPKAEDLGKVNEDYHSLKEAISLGSDAFKDEASKKVLSERVAVLLAKENDDLLYEEYNRLLSEAESLRKNICRKYSIISENRTNSLIESMEMVEQKFAANKNDMFKKLHEQQDINKAKSEAVRLTEDETAFRN